MPIKVPPLSRSFCFTFTVAWLLVIVSAFTYATSQPYDDIGHLSTNSTQPSSPCRIEYFDSDQCSFVHNNCGRINDLSLVPYLKWYYCARPNVRGALLAALLLWLVVVFAAMATAADKFLAVNLASLVHSLKISENLAGVTIFAFGNGSSDLFSTLAAMNSGNGSLAIAELFGAAAFITAMVLGAIMIIRPFNVDRRAFLGDVVCFLVCASVNLILISDGSLELWESFVIIVLYVSFVAFVLIRDRNKVEDIVMRAATEDDGLKDTERGLEQVEETTALIREPTGMISYVSKSSETNPHGNSPKTLVVEEATEDSNIDSDTTISGPSDTTSLSDWASECEHMAEVPPFIELCAAVKSFRVNSFKSLLSGFIRLPALVIVGMTTVTQPEIEHSDPRIGDGSVRWKGSTTSITNEPERHPKEYWLLCIQMVLGPQFLAWIIWSDATSSDISKFYVASLVLLCCSSIFLIISRNGLLHPGPYLHVFLCNFGFFTATAWIYVLASEAVALIETLGVISNISDALLGATVFAIGNSSDDIFANLSVAKRGHPILASAACLGGPMLNTLLGIGFGSLIRIVRGNYQPYVFAVPASLFVSAASLLTGLSLVFGYVLVRGGRLDMYLGYSLMALWIGFTGLNVWVSTRG